MSISENNFSKLLSWFFSTKSNYVFEKEPWNKKLFSELLCQIYSFLKNKNKNKNKLINSKILNNFNENDYGKDFLSPIKKIKKNFSNLKKENLLEDVILHGSFGTLDYEIGWSDLDISIILGKNSFKSHLVLSSIRDKILTNVKYLFRIDPLQHHEFLISADIIQNYSLEPTIPTIVLLNGKSLIGNKQIKYLENQSTKQQAQKRLIDISTMLKNSAKFKYMDHHSLNGVYLEENFKNTNTMYQLKYLLALIMTLPSHYLDACGNACYKKHSFEIIKKNKNINFEILEKASFIRSEWPKRMTHPFKGNIIPEWIKKELGTNYFKRTLKFCNSLINYKK